MEENIKQLFLEKKGTKQYKKVISEKHVSVIKKQNSKFFRHIEPKSGTKKDIADSILTFLDDREHNEQLLNFTAIGNGTVVNTGRHSGVISLIFCTSSCTPFVSLSIASVSKYIE